MRRWTEWDGLDNSRLFFVLNSVAYRNGTVVKFNDAYMNSNHKGKYPHGTFCYKEQDDDVYVFYTKSLIKQKMQCGYFRVRGCDLENVIDEITFPFTVTIHTVRTSNIFDIPNIGVAIFIYVLVMLFSLVFKDFILIWIVATVCIIKFCKNKMKPVCYIQDN